MTKQEVTNEQIMQILSKFADDVNRRFESQEHFNLQLMSKMNTLENEALNIKESMATKEGLNLLKNTVDRYAEKIDAYAMEMASMQHKIDRLERMIDYLAEKAGISKQTLEAL